MASVRPSRGCFSAFNEISAYVALVVMPGIAQFVCNNSSQNGESDATVALTNCVVTCSSTDRPCSRATDIAIRGIETLWHDMQPLFLKNCGLVPAINARLLTAVREISPRSRRLSEDWWTATRCCLGGPGAPDSSNNVTTAVSPIFRAHARAVS